MWQIFESIRGYPKTDVSYRVMFSQGSFRGEVLKNGKLIFQTQIYHGKHYNEMTEFEKTMARFRSGMGDGFFDTDALAKAKNEMFAFCRQRRKS